MPTFLHVCVSQEMEQMQRYNQRLIEEMKNKQTQERARLPKIQRSEAKTRMAMYKKSLRITAAAGTPEQERERIKQVMAQCMHTALLFYRFHLSYSG